MEEQKEEKPLTKGVLKEVLKEELKEYTKDVLIPVVTSIVNKEIEGLAGMTQRGFEEMGKRFDKLEQIILGDHKKRIEKLEDQVKELREAVLLK